ncbi:gustatory and odorant receptor 63a isoform X1 [Eurosta solidaginis]|uniref:gustatory and odorant receptor 63a isoform X1 n=2 Tax=Eurosta solidaginis TaxID=178769 RepID=UPI003530C4DC
MEKMSIFYNNIAPIQLFLHMIGVLPITRREPGKAKFLLISIPFGYSLVFFGILATYVTYVAKNRISIVKRLSGPFEEAVIAYLFLVNILPLVLVPILWLEARKIARLWNDWDDFEILYYQISGHSLPLNLRRKSTTIAIVLPILSILSVVITHTTMADIQFIQVIPYCLLDNLTAMLGAWWFIICESLSMTANILGDRFQRVRYHKHFWKFLLKYQYLSSLAGYQALRHIGPAAMVADYRALWLRLSKLTRDTGNATCYTFTFLNLYLFFIITLSVYGLMSQLSEGFGIKDIGLAITAMWNVFLLFYICDKAHYASFDVRTNFQKKLLMVELNWMNSDAQTEINMFIRATEMNPSNINCGGFFNVNRNLFKGLLTTMVTYLVVLLQFQISIPIDAARNKNVSLAELANDMLLNKAEDEMTSSATTPLTTTTRATTKMHPPKGRK